MINPDNVFVANTRAALALPVQRSAYVFGAAHPLGEALLAQVLASTVYTKVYVATTAPLPTTVAHLYGVLSYGSSEQLFELEDECESFDFIFLAQANRANHSVSVPTMPAKKLGFAAHSNVYAPLYAADVPALLSAICIAVGSKTANMRCLIAAPSSPVSLAASWVTSYSNHFACMVYGLSSSQGDASQKVAYQFKPQNQSILDRAGVWVLNALSNVVHGMMNPQTSAPLSIAKTAQRLAARFAELGCYSQPGPMLELRSKPSNRLTDYANAGIIQPLDALAAVSVTLTLADLV